MNDLVKQEAFRIGFDACRVTSAAAPASADRFRNWLAKGCHGEMAYLVRNSDKRVDPQQVLPGARSMIMLATSYYQPSKSAQPTPSSGVIARYAQFSDYHHVLKEKLASLAAFLNRLGGTATRSVWYVDTGPILERDLAERAGLGFIGKHTNLISRELGNWFFISEVLTTLELKPDAAGRNLCGTCTRCLRACPTNAIVRPFELDARRCISYLTIELKGAIPETLRPLIGNRIFGCDDCLQVCPWNRFAKSGQMMRAHAQADLETPNLLRLVELDEAGFKAKFRGTAVERTKRKGLLRNVCVALGNIGGEEALPGLSKASQEPEPLIAEHARWAIEQIRARNR